MLYREIIAVCSEIHTKHTNTAVWAERRIVNVKLAVFEPGTANSVVKNDAIFSCCELKVLIKGCNCICYVHSNNFNSESQ